MQVTDIKNSHPKLVLGIQRQTTAENRGVTHRTKTQISHKQTHTDRLTHSLSPKHSTVYEVYSIIHKKGVIPVM